MTNTTTGTYTSTRDLKVGDALGAFPGHERRVNTTPTQNTYGTFRFEITNTTTATGAVEIEKITAAGWEKFRVIG